MTAPLSECSRINKQTRRLCIEINGSMQQFAKSGHDAASWCPNNAKIGEILGVSDVFDNNPDVGTTASCLQNAILHKVTLLEIKNDFPINIGVTMSCIPSDEATRLGNRFAVTTFAGSHNPNPSVLFEADAASTEAVQWRQNYPTYNNANLEKEGVLELGTQQNYLFMSKNHPVVEILRTNKDILNADIDKCPLIDNQYYKITRQVFSTCCGALRSKILTKVATRDLNNLSVQMFPLQKKDWQNICVSDEMLRAVPADMLERGNAEEITGFIKQLCMRQCSLSMRLEMTYEVPTRV
jgi:hypothetical protein